MTVDSPNNKPHELKMTVDSGSLQRNSPANARDLNNQKKLISSPPRSGIEEQSNASEEQYKLTPEDFKNKNWDKVMKRNYYLLSQYDKKKEQMIA